jgi:hypothetical protein
MVARPPSSRCVACRGGGRIKDKHHHLKIRVVAGHWFGDEDSGAAVRHGYTGVVTEDPAEAGFLSEGGWHIEKAGTTGQPIGRPATGIRDEDALIDAINEGLAKDQYRAARVKTLSDLPRHLTRSELHALRKELTNAVRREAINTKTVAQLYGLKSLTQRGT